MTFGSLALNNVRGSWRRYLAYFLSCSFSVASFYAFMALSLLPEIRASQDLGGAGHALGTLIHLAEAIIILFSALFIVYSTSAFIRARKKEFGLLTLMGMAQRQIRRTVFYELSVIALAALTTGVAAGIFFSKIFFMAAIAVIGATTPVAFAIPLRAVEVTIVAFGGIFAAANWRSLSDVRASSIKELLKAHRAAKPGPRKNILKLLLGVVLIGAGYRLAWTTDTIHILGLRAVPIVALTVTGTYFLVTQGALFVCDWLRRLTAYYRRGTNLLVINRLVFRLTDNARVIFISAVLIAVVGSAVGGTNAALQGASRMALTENPYALTIHPSGSADTDALVATVSAVLEKQGVTGLTSQVVTGVSGELDLPDRNRDVGIAPAASYERWAGMTAGLKRVTLAPGEALLLLPRDPSLRLTGLSGQVSVGAKHADVKIVGVLIQNWLPSADSLVLSDADYAAVASGAADDVSVVGFEFGDWRNHTGLGAIVAAATNQSLAISNRADFYQATRQQASLLLFIGLFIATLFFVAADSLIYFKLFTEIGEDRAQYAVLRDIGVTGGEVSRLVGGELAALFFAPLVIGAIHAAFALKTLSNISLTKLDFVGPGIAIGLAYLAAQALYFMATARSYKREVGPTDTHLTSL